MHGAKIAIIVLRHFGFVATLVAGAALSPAAAQNPGPLYTVTTIGGTTLPPYAGNGDGGLALDARVSGESLARDSKGNLYIGERGTGHVRKIDPSGTITTVAGPGVPGFSADGAAGTIQLGFSLGIAVDAADALIIADTDHHRVLRLDASGTVRTIAGTGAPGSSGDGGPATSATLTLPFGLAFDRAGNLFIGEYSTGRVRRVTPDGVIATVAQHACPRANCSVWGLAVDGAGDLYIADGISTIAKMTPDGAIATIAGSDPAGFSGDGGSAATARFYAPSGIALDHAGNLYVADTQNQRIRKISPDGIVTTVAGNGAGMFSGDGGPPVGGVLLGPGRDATKSQLQFPVAVLPDDSGNLFIAEQSLVRKVDAAGRLFAIAGTNAPGEGGIATSAQLQTPASVATDAARNIYFSDASANRVRRIGADGILTTVAGTGEQGYEGDGGPASAAVLNRPLGIALDGAGNLYVADSQNQCVRKIGSDGIVRTVLARGAGAAGSADSGLFIPTSLAVDRSGNLYIADPLMQRVRKLAPDGTLQTVAGGGPSDHLGDGGPAIGAFLQNPEGIAFDPAGNLYIADSGQHRIRRVSPAGIISTVAGKGNDRVEPVRDGIPAISAYLPDPAAVAVDAKGNVFISDRYDSSVRVVGADGIITTLAGYGADVAGADGGPAFAVGLSTPHGILTDATSGLYVAEGDSIAPGRVRRIEPQPATGGTPRLWAVLNDGSWQRGEPFSPGAIVSLFGTDLGPTAGVTNRPNSSGRYGTDLAGVRVLFNGIPAPILYAQAYQVNVVVPFAVPLETAVAVEVTYNGKTSQYVSNVAIGCCVAALPELLKPSASPRPGQAAALNQDGSINSADNPAAAGSIVTLYATGAGAMNPPLQDGVVVTDTSSRPAVPLTVRIGGVTTDVLYAGPAPGLVAGVLQINARVPQTLVCWGIPACNDQSATPVFLQMGQYFSSQAATIAVRY
jgi:uncharacterized protein (TIGR03437 family)